MGSFFKQLGSVFSKLFGKAPSVLQTVSSVISFVSPLTSGIISLVGGEALSGEVAKIIAEVQSDLATLATVINQAHGAPSASVLSTAANTLSAINSNLNGLLQAGHIKDPATVSKVTALVNTITGEIGAVLGMLGFQQQTGSGSAAPGSTVTSVHT